MQKNKNNGKKSAKNNSEIIPFHMVSHSDFLFLVPNGLEMGFIFGILFGYLVFSK
jgi:lipid-binding SYLF domain-containing protein